MKQFIKYVGLDVHKESIAVVIVDATGGQPRYYGEIDNTVTAISQLVNEVSPTGELLSCCSNQC